MTSPAFDDGDPMVTLSGGLCIPLPALETLWALEHRGLSVTIRADMLVVGPSVDLTDVDRGRIRQYRTALIMLVAHCETVH